MRITNTTHLGVTLKPLGTDTSITHYKITTDVIGPFSFQTTSHDISVANTGNIDNQITVNILRSKKPLLLLSEQTDFAADGSVSGGLTSRTAVVPLVAFDGGSFSFSAWVKCSNPKLDNNRIFDFGNGEGHGHGGPTRVSAHMEHR